MADPVGLSGNRLSIIDERERKQPCTHEYAMHGHNEVGNGR